MLTIQPSSAAQSQRGGEKNMLISDKVMLANFICPHQHPRPGSLHPLHLPCVPEADLGRHNQWADLWLLAGWSQWKPWHKMGGRWGEAGPCTPGPTSCGVLADAWAATQYQQPWPLDSLPGFQWPLLPSSRGPLHPLLLHPSFAGAQSLVAFNTPPSLLKIAQLLNSLQIPAIPSHPTAEFPTLPVKQMNCQKRRTVVAWRLQLCCKSKGKVVTVRKWEMSLTVTPEHSRLENRKKHWCPPLLDRENQDYRFIFFQWEYQHNKCLHFKRLSKIFRK